MATIKLRRGLRSALPGFTGADIAELLVTTDTNELWIGKGVGNAPVPLNVSALLPASYAASATSTTAQSFTSGTTTIVNYATIENDPYTDITTGAAWKYTASVYGLYDVSTFITFQSYSWAAGNTCDLMLYKNGVLLRYLQRYTHLTSRTMQLSVAGCTKIWLSQNDYVDIRLVQNRGTSALQASAQMNWVSIAKEF